MGGKARDLSGTRRTLFINKMLPSTVDKRGAGDKDRAEDGVIPRELQQGRVAGAMLW